MIVDFPNAPSDGAIFEAPNGVRYIWDAARGLWMLSGIGSLPAQGDFFARNSTQAGLAANTWYRMGFDQVISGNVDNAYDPATSKWQPPPGRYHVFATVGGWAGTATMLHAQLRKNDSIVIQATQVPAGSNWPGDPSVVANIDADGSDVFDIWTYANNGSVIDPHTAWFGAFPISHVTSVSPPPSSGWRLIERIVPTAGQTNVDFTSIPPDINDVELRFDVQPQTNDETLWAQFYDGSGTLVTANYNWSTGMQQSNSAANDPVLQRSGGTANTAYSFALSFWGIGYGISNAATGGIRGRLSIPNIRDSTRPKGGSFQSDYLRADGNVAYTVQGGVLRNLQMVLGGVRLYFGSGSFAAGGAASLWGSP